MNLHPGPEKSRRAIGGKPDEGEPIRQALRENQDWYQYLVEHSQDLLCVHDLEGRLLSVNPAPARVLGYSVEELLRIPLGDIAAPEFRSQYDDYLKEIAHNGESRGFMSVLTRSGERRVWRYHSTLRTEGVESPIVRVTAHDVTEQTIAEKMLRARHTELVKAAQERERTLQELKLFRTLLDQSSDAISVVDPQTLRFLDVNERTCIEYGYSREELLSMTVYDIDSGSDLQMRAQVLQRIEETGSAIFERVHRRKDGSLFPAEVTVRRVHLDRTYAVAIARDITARKEDEAQLQTSESSYRAVYDHARVGICRVDVSGQFLEVNPKFCEIAGRTENDLLGRTFQSITHPNDLSENLGNLGRMADGELRHHEVIKRYIRPDGSIRWVEVDVAAIWSDGRNPDWLIATVQDITERKESEEALGKNEQRFRIALEGSPITVFNQDRDLRYTWVYNSQEGWSEADYLGKTDKEIYAPEAAAKLNAIKRTVLETGQGVRQEISLDAGGKIYFCDLTVEPLRDAAGSVVGVNCACVDITHLKKIREELREAKEKLAEEKLYLEEALDTELGFGEIIGRSGALKDVMQKVAKVAPSDATVLLLGETGTGKELVARALHRLSKRHANSFIKLNCAAIPSGLLESELFGHEKGAFTGAVARKLGRLELADQGTLFLDEIGEIPRELQPKLLRVLQDQEFERLGGTQTLRVNFRLLAASNRDLAQSVKQQEFRSDLFYRLNVFPIHIPPLRERREDIRLLVEHFVGKYGHRLNKSITSVPSKTMEALVRWEWPGNIRELENFVERSVILSPGAVLQAPLVELRAATEEVDGVTLRDKERERILRALRECHGQLGGAKGAAARLGLNRTTLQSKLIHLGINPEKFRR